MEILIAISAAHSCLKILGHFLAEGFVKINYAGFILPLLILPRFEAAGLSFSGLSALALEFFSSL